MSDLFNRPGVVPTQQHEAKVVPIKPYGVSVVVEEHDSGNVYWVERTRQGCASTASVMYTLDELIELRSRINQVLGL